MPENTPPTGAPATGATGSQPGATGQDASGLVSQGPNDPINPPATGGQGGQGGTPATGEPTEQERRERNSQEALSRMAQERDEARRQLEEERRKGLSDEERKRLQDLDTAAKARDERERNLILRYEIASRAPKLGIVDTDVAVMLLEKSSKITVDTSGTVAGVDEALKDLIKEKPFLVAKTPVPGVDAGAGSGGSRSGGKVSMNDIIRGAARGRTITGE